MKIEELMTKTPTTILGQDTLDAAAQKLWDSDCGVLPVVGGDGRLVGIITDRDKRLHSCARLRPRIAKRMQLHAAHA